MKLKRLLTLFLSSLLLITCVSCSNSEQATPDMEPQLSQMKAICDLAVMKCYYHNVAKFNQENASGFWLWAKDKHFWIEYSGIVTLGIDTSLVEMEISGDTVTITMPEAEVLDCTVDSTSLTKDSFIVDQDSAKITADDETAAFAEAQNVMRTSAENDRFLLNSARQRAQNLLENYVTTVGNAIQHNYRVKFTDQKNNQLPKSSSDSTHDTASDEALEAND